MSRIMNNRAVKAMVAADTYQDLAARVANLFGHHRHISLVEGQLYPDGTRDGTPQLRTGLTLLRPAEKWTRTDGARGITVALQPDLCSLGFSVGGADTPDERAQWERHDAGDLAGLTQVRITGGMNGDGPARDDTLVIRQWNDRATCRETIIGFDYGTGPCNLTTLLPELDQYMATRTAISAPDRVMLERIQGLLLEHLAHTLHPAPAPACTLIPSGAGINPLAPVTGP